MKQYTYLLLDLLSISIPFARSFEERIQFVKKWGALLPAIGIVGLGFIIWDVVFTSHGIWGFNQDYLIGIDVFGLPIEEILFFFCIPYACMFIYEALRYFWPKKSESASFGLFTKVFGLVVFIIGVLHWDHAYTSVTFILSGLIILLYFLLNGPNFLREFWIGYIVTLIPFFIVNGMLTGSWLESPIVWYNNAENLGIRLGTIPLDDSIYLFLLLFSITWIYESRLKRMK